ncbi:LysM peptidoglycan-binding domain-containing protein [Shewanella aestuarii]|uniref:LysM peptidoglycan-binding domain-containing protein n=1 Tax=Shewanella aestuarii TaxID=1028752 RepID=A0A6G9QJ24_9GAMM|nr:LysM peptidoglycan-binding domain-containing protein [Shewanella aestuarii]QIR14554.1 LysM peptidoglycan-binding domain-containing protein [Shewanella aestuarii]
MKTKLSLLAATIMLVTGCQTVTPENDINIIETPQPIKNTTQAKKVTSTSLADIEQDVAEVTEIWQRIRDGMQLTIVDKDLVAQYRQWYIDNPKHLEIVTERAAPFLYYIVEEVEKRNLPTELALLPVIESAFIPTAYSQSHASGLWQLTAPTAATFGVKSDWWYDGRRDIRASTIAALDLLEYLYKKMGNNWNYAIAAYNSGEGRVFNAIKKNEGKGKETTFWKLDLPRETAHYLPQLLALADIIKNSQQLGLPLYPIQNRPAIEMVNIDSQIDLNLAAQLAGVSLDEIKRLNPGLKRWATAPTGPHYLAIPSDNADQFKQSLAAIDPDSRINWVRYKIKSGDSISEIASRFETSASLIRSSNGIKGNNIIAGRYLIIPVATIDPDLPALATEQTLARKPVVLSSNTQQVYKVKSGDSLWGISRSNNVTVAQILKWNKIDQSKPLKIGQNIIFYPKQVVNTSDINGKIVSYKVRSGDSLARIAAKYKVTVSELIEWNSLQDSKYIQPGQMLKLLISNS